VDAYWRFNPKEKCKLLALKVATVAYKRRMVAYKRFDLETFGILENWSPREVVATGGSTAFKKLEKFLIL